jgi:hypothetical protein
MSRGGVSYVSAQLLEKSRVVSRRTGGALSCGLQKLRHLDHAFLAPTGCREEGHEKQSSYCFKRSGFDRMDHSTTAA